ncbi:DNA polymerase III subunit alpha [Blattabacterium cuenoti]|uniref:DNA polymerase III subunit alpha n=1 Tax=Blattabacterium cuenoti TaxID=1653831 RepID=UPI00163C0967|nr:DNA polymerase III subunit alpha [Blattabacterium cuenoti]
MYLIIDTETTGLPLFINYSNSDINNWPRIVQFSWQVHGILGDLIEFKNFIIKPDNFDIPFNSFKIHGINNKIAEKYGYPLIFVLNEFKKTFDKYKYIVGHNLDFDLKIIECEFLRKKETISFQKKKKFDTQLISVNYCQIPGSRRKFKWPTLSELYYKLFSEIIPNVHNAANDVKATSRCFLELLRIGLISDLDKDITDSFKNKYSYKIPSNLVSFEKTNIIKKELKKSNRNKQNKKELEYNWNKKNFSYSQIHNHTHFSILCSTISIKSLIKKAMDLNMPAVGIIDYGNMMGTFHFLNTIHSLNEKYYPNKYIKGIVGCELFISENYLQKKFTKEQPDRRYTQVLLSKNKKGYHNLIKICSFGFIHGFYSGIPRIGKNIIEDYKEDLIALTGDINSEIPYTILNYGEKKAEKLFLWWKDLFKDDFYVELLRHGLEEEDYVNEVLIKFSKKYNVKYIVQNNVFYMDKKEYHAHDILLCIKNGHQQSTPIGKGKGFRFGLSSNQHFFKSKEEMKQLFLDLPESFDSLKELVNKIEPYHILRKIILPKFRINDSSDNSKKIGENFILSKLTYEGAKKRYKNITKEIHNRINFELETIKKIGYSGYFLIIQDIIYQAKKMNISVGPGRGSVAGSVVAYCIGITEIDPIKYNLLFERFLNPDRISLPDIDIDFDDKGREKIIDWVTKKYGKDKVAQIVTYSTMGAKSSIRDIGRVLGLSLDKTDYIAKMIPNNLSLKNILDENIPLEKINKEEIRNIHNIRKIANNEKSLSSKVLKQAKILEGTIRSTGVHACGIIISPWDIKNIVPVSVSKESNLLVTQFDNNVVEHTGLLKMDFLGLKTLSVIKNTINLIKKRYNKNDISFPLNDKKTYSLFQKGETIAIFQYESTGMQKYLCRLKPDKFDDIIAMNALYRPGPLQYIPNFISRKNGKETIRYDLPEMEEILKETYGITIYQEQVMLISQKLADFSKGEADLLRKSMGKKQREVLDKMKNEFINRSVCKGYNKNIIEKIWRDWEHFSCYAFNKSHATCYAYIAFQTAYLKAHYPCEYMTYVLSSHMHNIKQLNFFIKECKRMEFFIKKPDINESHSTFRSISKNCIQFGLTGIKGVGENAVKKIIEEREKNGLFSSIFDLVNRVDLRVVNKKTLENLVLSGALDNFNIRREQYFHIEDSEELSFLEKIIKFGSRKKNNKKIDIPIIVDCDKWSNIKILSKEKEVLGTYVSSHPLYDFSYEIKYLTNLSIDKFNRKELINNKHKHYYTFVGILSKIEDRFYAKHSIRYGIFSLDDYNSSKEFRIYGKKYLKYKSILFKNNLLFLFVSIDKENRIHILHIEELKNVFTNLVHKLILKININDLDQLLIDNIENIVIHNKGEKKLNFILYDQERNISINLQSNKYGVNISSIILNKLNNIKEIDLFLN